MKSAHEAPRKVRFNRAKLQISGGSRYIKTNATQLSGISPSLGCTEPSMLETPPDKLAPITEIPQPEPESRLSIQRYTKPRIRFGSKP